MTKTSRSGGTSKDLSITLLFGRDDDKEKTTKEILEKARTKLGGDGSRREEFFGAELRYVPPEEHPDLVVGKPELLFKHKSGRPLIPSIVILEGNEWTEEAEKALMSPDIAVAGVFRFDRLKEQDAEEIYRFETCLTRCWRRALKPKTGEKDLAKPIDWKIRLPERDPRGFVSLLADESMQDLFFRLKSALRKIKASYDEDFKNFRSKNPFIGQKGQQGEFTWEEAVEKNGTDWPRGPLPSILLLGESGTGKTLLAEWIAENLTGGRGPEFFHHVNMSAVPQDLVDSKLFGQVKGAFTDAHRDTPGVFWANRGRTVFLDEIGDMRPEHQCRLLTFMDTGYVTPLGDDTISLPAPCVLVAATNRPVREWVAAGDTRFRADLYHRFNHVVTVPTLSERRREIRTLISLVLQRERVNPLGAVGRISLDAIEWLETRVYRGNFRELEALLSRAVDKARLEGSDTLLLRHCLLFNE